jgi:hypothetical protein
VVVMSKVDVLPLTFARQQFDRLKLKCSTLPSTKCLIPKRKPREDGYVRFTVTKDQAIQLGLGSGEKSYYLHCLAFYCTHGYVPNGVGRHTSHRCHNPCCCNVDHLVDETAEENNSRKNCLVWYKCPHECCINKPSTSMCSHTPPCIKAVPSQ